MAISISAIPASAAERFPASAEIFASMVMGCRRIALIRQKSARMTSFRRRWRFGNRYKRSLYRHILHEWVAARAPMAHTLA
jgi:hypothetical protein